MTRTKDTNQSSLAINRNQDQGAAGKVAEGPSPLRGGPCPHERKAASQGDKAGEEQGQEGSGGRLTMGAGQEEKDRTRTRRPEQAASDHQRLKAQAWDTRGPQKHPWRGTCTSQ